MNLLQYCFCFMIWFFDLEACGNLHSLTRDWTSTPCFGRWSLNCWAARQVPGLKGFYRPARKWQSSVPLLLHWPEFGPMVTLLKEEGVHKHPPLCHVGEVLPLWVPGSVSKVQRSCSVESMRLLPVLCPWVSCFIIAKQSEQIGLASHSWLGSPTSFAERWRQPFPKSLFEMLIKVLVPHHCLSRNNVRTHLSLSRSSERPNLNSFHQGQMSLIRGNLYEILIARCSVQV